MSLVHLSHVCSHLQNASLARLGLTSIPHSRLHLHLSVELQRQGFLSTVVLGGQAPPRKLLPAKEEEDESNLDEDIPLAPPLPQSDSQGIPRLRYVNVPEEQEIRDIDVEVSPKVRLDDEEDARSGMVTQSNRATRRLWLGLKYWDGEPVLRKMRMISKPTQRLWLTNDDLSRIVRGRRANYVEGLTRIGECLFISTDRGVMEARECMERGAGGMALCRVWG